VDANRSLCESNSIVRAVTAENNNRFLTIYASTEVLMRPSLAGIPTMMDVSRKSVNRIKFNFIWSFVYNRSLCESNSIVRAVTAENNNRFLTIYASTEEHLDIVLLVGGRVYGLEDELRPDAAGTIETLHRRGVSVHVVSGDDDGAVQSLASKLSIPVDSKAEDSVPLSKHRLNNFIFR
jgi:cation transport ATPase